MTQRRNPIGERLSPRMMRRMLNLWPCIRGTGVRYTYIADDWTEVSVRLRLSLRTRNYVGTIFGGSLYGAVDPCAMILLMRQLGNDFVVWDKAATIRFRKPAKTTLTATLRIPPSEIAELKREVVAAGSVERTWTVDLVDSAGTVYASVDKLIYVATREAYAARSAQRKVQS
jgi:acyl-coenzyme A thioesterase PaaI-like protein